MIVGSFGIIWLIPWLIINKKIPAEHPWLSDEEREYILSGQSEQDRKNVKGKGLSLKQILSYTRILVSISCKIFP